MKKLALFATIASLAFSTFAVVVEWAGGLSDLGGVSASSISCWYVIVDKTAYEAASNMSSEQIYRSYYDQLTEDTAGWINLVFQHGYGESEVTLDGDNAAYAIGVYSYEDDGQTYAIAGVGRHEGSLYNPTVSLDDTSKYIAERAFAKNGNQWSAVPEPTTLALLAMGLVMVGARRKIA